MRLIRAGAWLGIGASVACSGCSPALQTRTFYAAVEKKPQAVPVSYSVPDLTQTAQTKQLQKKGDITVSVEVEKFRATRRMETTERVAPSANPEFDNYEIENRPTYEIAPDRIVFNVRVKNGSPRVLKLAEVAIVFVVDGTQVKVDGEKISEEWIGGLLIPGSEKVYSVTGPKTSSLPKSSVVGIYLYDMPVKYDPAGNVVQKQNFEWYFKYSVKTEVVTEQVTFTYRNAPIYKETCSVCGGVGHTTSSCEHCNGTGKRTNKDGKVVSCAWCGGDGAIDKDCSRCVDGKIAHRKSADPVIDEQWHGYDVVVSTLPAGADVYVMDPESQQYSRVGSTPARVRWWEVRTKMPGDKFPIRISLGSQVIEVSARQDGKVIPKVVVDFTTGAPAVVKGTQVSAVKPGG